MTSQNVLIEKEIILNDDRDNYANFLVNKTKAEYIFGFDIKDNQLDESLFPFQRDIIKILCKRGRSCCFAQTGLGKTRIQIEFAFLVKEFLLDSIRRSERKGNENIIIFAPLAVTQQTIKEAALLGIELVYCHDQKEAEFNKGKIIISNYERIERFNRKYFNCTILDESSIIKGYDSSTRKLLNDFSDRHQYKLALSATPAPNDYIELLNHAEWLGILSIKEAISLFFIQDGNRSNRYRLKNHAVKDFWRWVGSWSLAISKPSDLNLDYDDSLYNLPPLYIKDEFIEDDESINQNLFYVAEELKGIEEERNYRKESLTKRVDKVKEIIDRYPVDTPILIWCELNQENDILAKELDIEMKKKGRENYVKDIAGKHSIEQKEERLISFSDDKTKILITKPTIAGFGLNWQHCNVMIFVGLSHSFEKSYQAIRRCWRFGQSKPVYVYFIQSEKEGNIRENYSRKENEYKEMMNELVVLINQNRYNKNTYNPSQSIQLPLFLR